MTVLGPASWRTCTQEAGRQEAACSSLVPTLYGTEVCPCHYCCPPLLQPQGLRGAVAQLEAEKAQLASELAAATARWHDAGRIPTPSSSSSAPQQQQGGQGRDWGSPSGAAAGVGTEGLAVAAEAAQLRGRLQAVEEELARAQVRPTGWTHTPTSANLHLTGEGISAPWGPAAGCPLVNHWQ